MITYLVILALIVGIGWILYHLVLSPKAINRKVLRDRARAARRNQ